MILFIASMIIAASVAGVFTSSVDELSNAIEDQGPEVSDQVRTDIEIISDSGSDNVYNSDGTDNVTLLVKNIGTNDLVPADTQIDVLVNGEFQSADSVGIELLGDGELWSVDEVIRVEIDIDGTLDPGDHRAKVIVNGDEDTFEFKVT